jgi:hypothetical protein
MDMARGFKTALVFKEALHRWITAKHVYVPAPRRADAADGDV